METTIERIRDANRIEDVVEESGFPLRGGGRYRRGVEHDSLIVDVQKQAYFWNSRDETGDVFAWVMRREKTDFKGAVEWLAKRAGLPAPTWGRQTATAVAARRTVDALTAAAPVFYGWLRRDERALAYARGRGWTDETIEAAMLGYSGSGTPSEIKHLRETLKTAGVDLESPAAVALLGYRGDVSGWARSHGARVQPQWVEKGRIPGLAGMRMLIYPHWRNGTVRYMSGRSIEGKKWHYNLPRELVGERQMYYNHAHTHNSDEVVIVEGQADAVTLGQWGIPAIALAGVALNFADAWQMGKKYAGVYIGLDNDDPGRGKAIKMATTIGPLTRVLAWPRLPLDDETVTKDANDLLKLWVREGKPAEEQIEAVRELMAAAEPVLLLLAEEAGTLQGVQREQAQRRVVRLLVRADEVARAQYKAQVAQRMGVGVRDLNGMVRALLKKKKQDGGDDDDDDDDDREPVYIIGGYIREHLIELLYDEERGGKTKFAVRDPEGHVRETDEIVIGRVKYVPVTPGPEITKKVVLLPSKLPDAAASTRELVAMIRMFIHRYLDVDEFYEQLAAFYVLFTWVYDSFRVVPYLRALGDYGTGKSRLIETIGALCYRPIFTFGASTVSPIFRLLDQYHGTLVLDEADFSRSDESADIIKLLNAGYKSGAVIMRAKDQGAGKGYGVETFEVFGPKVIATRRKFADRALESRCLTKEMGGGTVREDIPIVLPAAFWKEALAIRNKLLAYRMYTWKPEVDVNYNAIDRSIEPRLNQVTLALKTMVDDEGLVQEIDNFIRNYNRQLVIERSMTLTAKVLEALVRIRFEEEPEEDRDGNKIWNLSMTHVAKITNDIIDEENEDEDAAEDEDEGRRRDKRLGPHKVGKIVRGPLGLRVERAASGPYKGRYVVVWDDQRIQALCKRYGVLYPARLPGMDAPAEAPTAVEE